MLRVVAGELKHPPLEWPWRQIGAFFGDIHDERKRQHNRMEQERRMSAARAAQRGR